MKSDITRRLRGILVWVSLLTVIYLAMSPVFGSMAIWIEGQSQIATEKWAEGRAGFRSGVSKATEITGVALDATVCLWLMVNTIIHTGQGVRRAYRRWRALPRWKRATLRLKRKPKKETETRAGALEL